MHILQRTQMIKSLLFIFLLTSTLLARDTRLDNYTDAKEWERKATSEGYAAFNLGVVYHKNIQDFEKAIYWYEKAYGMSDKDSSVSAASNLGYLYDDLNQYTKAIEWYKRAIVQGDKDAASNLGLLYKEKLQNYDLAIAYYTKAYEMGSMEGANNLGYLHEHTFNNLKQAEIWYKKAVAKNNQQAIGNLAKFYYKQNQKQLGTAYLISLINNGYSNQKFFYYLKTRWSLSDEEIKKAYQLQKTLDIPKHYYDAELEENPTSKTTNPRGQR